MSISISGEKSLTGNTKQFCDSATGNTKQFCNSAIAIPKLKCFEIKTRAIDSIAKDGSDIVTINIKAQVPTKAKPPITIKNGNVLFLNSSGEYVSFDSDIVENVYATASLDKMLNIASSFLVPCPDVSSSYSISIQPKDCSIPMRLGNVVLETPQYNQISKVSNDGTEIKLEKINNFNSCLLKKTLQANEGKNFEIKSSVFFEIKKDLISKILYDEDKKIDTINILENVKKPFLTLTNGNVQYLNENNEYQNFDLSLYQNVDCKAYKTSDLFGGLSSKFNSYMLRISQENINHAAKFANITLNPFENYFLNGNVEDDGTISYAKIPKDALYLLE